MDTPLSSLLFSPLPHTMDQAGQNTYNVVFSLAGKRI
jgi:hypothetical protein